MSMSVHQRVKVLLEETSYAYSFYSYNDVDTDYAEFAALALSEFKGALHDPSLTRPQLLERIRSGTNKHHEEKAANQQSCWASLVAHHIAQTANPPSEEDGAREASFVPPLPLIR